MFLFILFLLEVFCSSCTLYESRVRFEAQGKVTFDVGFVANFRYRGVFRDKQSKEQLFYFADPVTKKLVKFFDEKGKLRYEVPLHSALMELDQIEGMEIGALDTILLFEPHTNRILFIDRKGAIWRSCDLDDYVQPFQGAVFQYRPSFSDRCLSGRRLVLKADFISGPDGQQAKDLAEFFTAAIRQPYFLVVENIYQPDAGQISFGAIGFYRRFMDDLNAMGELGTFANYGSQIHAYSIFSDTLYVFDDSLTLSKRIHVAYGDTALRSKPFALDAEKADYIAHLERIKYEGHIAKSIELTRHKGFLVVVSQANRTKSPDGSGYAYVLYDVDGQWLGDVALDPKRFRTGIIYYTEDRFYVDGIVQDNDEYGKVEYHIFKLAH